MQLNKVFVNLFAKKALCCICLGMVPAKVTQLVAKLYFYPVLDCSPLVFRQLYAPFGNLAFQGD